ncbi:hypothetical protein AHV85_22280 [Salmonella enterica]|nr:hypothetical protein [Salmonella enterica]
MSDKREIYTGLYLFGAVDTKKSFGGVSGVIKFPDSRKEIMLYLNDKQQHKLEKIDNAVVYDLNINELEGLYSALGRIINDIRKLDELSKKDLLRDEAYSSSE